MSIILDVHARQIFDSRGNPTVEVDILTENGVLGRAALGSCLASGYMMWASSLDIVIDSLEIKIEADYDDGALFGTSDVPAGYSQVQYHVKINSPHSREEIEDFLDSADKHSPYLDVFSRAQHCKRKLKLNNQ